MRGGAALGIVTNVTKLRALILPFALFLGTCGDSRIYRAEEAVKEKLNDPYSAKFSELEVCPASADMVSGKVNAKNLMGAYTGSENFFVIGEQAYLSGVAGGWRPGDVRELRFYQALVNRCFSGEGPDSLMDFFNTYDEANDSMEQYLREIER